MDLEHLPKCPSCGKRCLRPEPCDECTGLTLSSYTGQIPDPAPKN